MFTTDNERRILRDWYREDRNEPGTKLDAYNLTPDVITDLLRYGHVLYTDTDSKRWLRMTIKGRRFIGDYLKVYHMFPEDD